MGMSRGPLAEQWYAAMQRAAERRGIELRPPSELTADAVIARVNHGRWLADCECNGAEEVRESEPFMCGSCMNAAHGGSWRPVQFPAPPVVAAIEGELGKRGVENRNWEPGETVEALRAQNAARGIA